MKKLIASIFFLITSFILHAECSIGSYQYFPADKNISLKSKFIIEGFGIFQDSISKLRERNIYLIDNNGVKTNLKVFKFYKGQYGLSQLILEPTHQLIPNTTYNLQFENQTSELRRYNPKTKKREKVYWKTSKTSSREPLNDDFQINLEKTDVIYYGCGPEANAIFNFKNKPGGEIWFKTEVVNLYTKEKVVYVIREWNEKLNVGHNMCYGAFSFDKKGTYKVRFTPMNIDGVQSKTTDWTTFESPYINNPFGY